MRQLLIFFLCKYSFINFKRKVCIPTCSELEKTTLYDIKISYVTSFVYEKDSKVNSQFIECHGSIDAT